MSDEEQLVILKLGSEEFGIPVQYVTSIIGMQPITRIPRAPSFLEGVINLRGQITAIVDLRKRFRMDLKVHDKATRIVVMTVEDIVVGLIVDAVYEVLRIAKKDIGAAPSVLQNETESKYVTGVGKVGERLIIIMDVRELLTKREIETLEKIEIKETKPKEAAPQGDK
jgi:purine-binding chemotaxis protein CheW